MQKDAQAATLAVRKATFVNGLNEATSPERPDHAAGSVATLLPASVRDAANEAARPIAHKTAQAEVDDEQHAAMPVIPTRKPQAKSSPGSSVTF